MENILIESAPKRRRTICVDDVTDIYNSDEDSIRLDKIESDVEGSNSSISSEDSADESSFTDSVVSEMDITNEDSSNFYLGNDKTKWFDSLDTTNFHSFDSFLPKIKDETCKDCETPLDFFHLFFTEALSKSIIEMSNIKLNEYLHRHLDNKSQYITELSLIELEGFYGLLILTGVFHSNRESILDLFSEDINKSKPIFKSTMPRDRLRVFFKFLRFDNTATRAQRYAIDKLAPIREVFETINNSLSKFYIPNSCVTVDEHLARYRGKCPFKQYIPSKPDRYGIKIYVLADAKTFYPINLEVYIGKTKLSNSPEEIVLRLATALKSGHIITGDNYFTSLRLSNRLLTERGIGYLGTIRKIRREVPRSLYPIAKRSLFSSKFVYTENHVLVSYMAKLRKNIFLLSSVHKKGTVSDGYKRKSNIILDYNKTKSGVDKLDQMLKEYRCYRATSRWPCVIFYDLIGFVSVAAWVLYSLKFPNYSIVKKKSRKEFLYILGKQLCNPLIQHRKESPGFKFCTNLLKSAISQQSESLLEKDPPKLQQSINPEHSVGPEQSINPDHSVGPEQSINPEHSVGPEQPIGLDHSINPEQYVGPEKSISPEHYFGPETCNDLEQSNSPGPSIIPVSSATSPEFMQTNSGTRDPKLKSKRGRCSMCERQSDKKFAKLCHFCGKIVCPQHSKTICVCISCEGSMA